MTTDKETTTATSEQLEDVVGESSRKRARSSVLSDVEIGRFGGNSTVQDISESEVSPLVFCFVFFFLFFLLFSLLSFFFILTFSTLFLHVLLALPVILITDCLPKWHHSGPLCFCFCPS